MNNLPLQPLKWEDREDSAMVTTMFRGYWVTSDIESKDKFCVYYGSSTGEPARGFASIEDAKHWAEHEHYQSDMQPYVKPAPTWIDASERLPDDKEKYLVLTECGKVWTGHYGLVSKNPNEWWLHGYTVKQGWHPYRIVGWMPIPEFSTMQNLHKGE